MHVPFLDLVAHHQPHRDDLIAGFSEILDSASFINGPRVRAFEEAFAEAHQVDHAIAVGNGTVALEIALRALDIGAGDRVVVPANTFIATAEAVSNVGADPVFVDCEIGTWNIDPRAVAEIVDAQEIAAVIAVHLYGQPAAVDELSSIARSCGAHLIEDAAQAHLARYRGRRVGGLGTIAGFSFYPGKNLGAIGEGGAITTNDGALAERSRSLRDHGQIQKYHSGEVGTNGRMSEFIGSALGLELPFLSDWTSRRREIAGLYRSRLEDVQGIRLPEEPDDVEGVYHLFVVHLDERERVREELAASDIGTGLHYPVPIHLQAAYSGHGRGQGSFPNAEWSAAHLLSLPMFPELSNDQVEFVCDQLIRIVAGDRS